MKVIDTCKGEKSKTPFQARCGSGKIPAIEQYCCKFQLKVVMDTVTNNWWLMLDSNIEDSHYSPVRKEA